MKSIAFLACLILSANAAPQKTAGLEQEASSVKSAKLQFTPADAQVYTSNAAAAALPRVAVAAAPAAVSSVDQYVAGNIPVVSAYDQVIPGYYSGANVYPGNVVRTVYPGEVPYYSAGRSTATTVHGANGLPAGTVYEHHGTTHIGHAANAVHIRRPGQLYNPAIVGSPLYTTAAGVVSGAPVPAHVIPSHLYATAYEGQIQWINGQPAQKVNGQWYYVNSAIPGVVNPLAVNQYSSVYTNLRSNVQPLAPGYAGKAWAAPFQPATQYTSTVLGYKPSVQDNKWYTKTNTQQVAQPFWSQGQVVQHVAATGTKNYAVPKPEVDDDKADF